MMNHNIGRLILICLIVKDNEGHNCFENDTVKTVENISETKANMSQEIVQNQTTIDNYDSETYVSSEESDDFEEAFSDIEDEDVLCSDYKALPRKKKFPTAIVIGARKGGTRALLEFINMNSRVRRAKPELHFFDNNFDKGIEWYINKMPEVTAGQIGIEKTPGYFHTPGVPQRIHSLAPDTKLVLIVRNPVTRLISDYNQFRSRNLDKGVDYPPLEKFLFTKEGNIDFAYPPLQRSIYHYHLVRWMEYFPLSQIHVVDGEKFIKEPWVGLGELENFLGLPNEITQDNFFFNATKGFYCGQEHLNMPGSGWTCSRKKCLNKSKGRPKAAVQDETYERLTTFFVSRNKMFFNLLKKYDFDWPEQWPPIKLNQTENETETPIES